MPAVSSIPVRPARGPRLWLQALVCLAKVSLAYWLVSIAAPAASADVGVVLNESLDEDVDRISSSGHSAVYFSRVCAESPVRLRLCRPGEAGSVMSNYINIGEDQPFEWNIVPLNIYLFGVEDARNRPLFGSYRFKRLLEDRYREKYLAGYCTTASCIDDQKAEWREMVAATLIRGVYIFSIRTTLEQDRQFIAEFNDAANKNHFNGLTHNCADFTKRIVNTYFPHSAKADYLNDFGMTSPKAVARTFTHYALHHPESQLRIMHFAQVPGTIKRSRIVRSGTEQLFHSGKLAVPMTLLAHYALPVVTMSYLTMARFNVEKTFERLPASLFAPENGPPNPQQQLLIVGTSAEWKERRRVLDAVIDESTAVEGRSELSQFFKQIDETGTPYLDENGAAWVEISTHGKPARIGLSASNIVAAASDSALSYEFLLARASRIVRSPAHARETMLEFQQDWANLGRASTRIALRKNTLTLRGAVAPPNPPSLMPR